jgi:hypothetical protein
MSIDNSCLDVKLRAGPQWWRSTSDVMNDSFMSSGAVNDSFMTSGVTLAT